MVAIGSKSYRREVLRGFSRDDCHYEFNIASSVIGREDMKTINSSVWSSSYFMSEVNVQIRHSGLHGVNPWAKARPRLELIGVHRLLDSVDVANYGGTCAT